MVLRRVFLSHKRLFGRGKLEGFSIFSSWAFLHFCYLKTAQSDPKERIWGHIGALLGSSWGILKDFASLLGPTVAPCGPLWHPKIEKKLGKGCPWNFIGSQGRSEAPKGSQKDPREHPKATKTSPKIGQTGNQGIFVKVGENTCQCSLLLEQNSVNTLVFTKLINMFVLLLCNQWHPSSYITN